MPAAAAVVLPPLLLEDEDLPVAALRDDRAANAGAADERRSDADGIVGGCDLGQDVFDWFYEPTLVEDINCDSGEVLDPP